MQEGIILTTKGEHVFSRPSGFAPDTDELRQKREELLVQEIQRIDRLKKRSLN